MADSSSTDCEAADDPANCPLKALTCTSVATTTEGYYRATTTSATCTACGSNCHACSGTTACTTCKDDGLPVSDHANKVAYFKNSGANTCGTCASKCFACTSATVCTTCVDTYYLTIATGCTACDTNCLVCASATRDGSEYAHCSSCATGYVLNSTTGACGYCLGNS